MVSLFVQTSTVVPLELNSDSHAASWPLTAHGEAVSVAVA